MELIKRQTNIDFMAQRKLAMVVSAVLLIVSLVTFFTRGLNLGLDFTGGTLVQVRYEQAIPLAEVRSTLDAAGYDDAVVQTFGGANEILVRLPLGAGLSEQDTDAVDNDEAAALVGDQVVAALNAAASGTVQKQRSEYVGPQIGAELAEKGGLAMVYALIGILVYIIVRFQWKFSVGAVAALVHDVVIVIGFFAITRVEFDLTVLAALLAVIGYSLNDTIVVYDRIRENFRAMRKGDGVSIFNASINQMLSRTVMTSLTTLLVLFALFFLGGEIIHAFAEALIVGVIIGTYSSIYVAGTALLYLNVSKGDLMPVQKEGAQLDHIP